jgi:hypothetical protein
LQPADNVIGDTPLRRDHPRGLDLDLSSMPVKAAGNQGKIGRITETLAPEDVRDAGTGFPRGSRSVFPRNHPRRVRFFVLMVPSRRRNHRVTSGDIARQFPVACALGTNPARGRPLRAGPRGCPSRNDRSVALWVSCTETDVSPTRRQVRVAGWSSKHCGPGEAPCFALLDCPRRPFP